MRASTHPRRDYGAPIPAETEAASLSKTARANSKRSPRLSRTIDARRGSATMSSSAGHWSLANDGRATRFWGITGHLSLFRGRSSPPRPAPRLAAFRLATTAGRASLPPAPNGSPPPAPNGARRGVIHPGRFRRRAVLASGLPPPGGAEAGRRRRRGANTPGRRPSARQGGAGAGRRGRGAPASR